MSSLLFVLEVKGLKSLLVKAQKIGLISRINIQGYNEYISLLQFVDDTFILVPTELTTLMNLRRILIYFEHILGLKMNFQKSSLLGIRDDYAFYFKLHL